eukprot:553752-Prorocentrum_minimum.AAC.2
MGFHGTNMRAVKVPLFEGSAASHIEQFDALKRNTSNVVKVSGPPLDTPSPDLAVACYDDMAASTEASGNGAPRTYRRRLLLRKQTIQHIEALLNKVNHEEGFFGELSMEIVNPIIVQEIGRHISPSYITYNAATSSGSRPSMPGSTVSKAARMQPWASWAMCPHRWPRAASEQFWKWCSQAC